MRTTERKRNEILMVLCGGKCEEMNALVCRKCWNIECDDDDDDEI
jgi:hypothetical protein